MRPPGQRRVIAAAPPVYETPLEQVQGLITPTSIFFMRNHVATPTIDVNTWEFSWQAAPGSYTIMTRATDEKGNTQPDTVPWNEQGYLYNGVIPHPVKVA